jgi:hypothetical protein
MEALAGCLESMTQLKKEWRELRKRQFERNFPPQPCIFGRMDFAHPASADFVEDPIVGDLFTDHRFMALLSAMPDAAVSRLASPCDRRNSPQSPGEPIAGAQVSVQS